MSITLEEQLTLIRVAVAALGERTTPPWWKTQFLTDAGVASMRMLFPHSGVASSVRSTCEAARELHDSRVAGSGRLHLFRLPVVQEYEVSRFLADEGVETEIESALSGGVEPLTELLRASADGEEPVGLDGPVSLGTVSESLGLDHVQRLARCYLTAFTEGRMVFPYFDFAQVPFA